MDLIDHEPNIVYSPLNYCGQWPYYVQSGFHYTLSGGSFSTEFPQKMIVDFVRVYKAR